jgi:putative Holliday junction resolvase
MIPEGRVLGVDLGSSRIGVAVSDSAQVLATGVAVIRRGGDRAVWQRSLAELAGEYRAVGVVVGVPYSLSGDTGPAARSALDELAGIRAAVGVDVETIDERFTTVVASGSLRNAGHGPSTTRAVVDQAAAASLLQTWLDRRRNGAERDVR